MVIDPFSPRDSVCLLFVSCCVLRTVFAAVRLEPPNMAGWKWGLHSFATRDPVTLASAPGSCVCLSCGCLWEVALDLGRVVSFAPSLGIPLVLMGFNTNKHIYCLSGL